MRSGVITSFLLDQELRDTLGVGARGAASRCAPDTIRTVATSLQTSITQRKPDADADATALRVPRSGCRKQW
jgi:hypothetical protein